MKPKTKLAVVTGGASGLGLATTQKFIQQGIRTIIIGRDEVKLASATQYGIPYVIAYTASKTVIEGIARGMAT